MIAPRVALWIAVLCTLAACDEDILLLPPSGRTHSDPQLIFCWGDSLTTAGWQIRLGQILWPYTPGIRVLDFSQPAQMAGGIAARQGGVELAISVENDSIPAGEGSVRVTSIAKSTPEVNLNWEVHGTLAGIAGILNMTLFDLSFGELGAVVFIPDSVPALDVLVPAGTPFLADGGPGFLGGDRANISDHNRESYKAINVFWIGRNDVAWGWPNGVAGPANALRSMVSMLTPDDPYFLVLGITNGQGEEVGTANYQLVTGMNGALQQEFPKRYIDVRRYLIDHGLRDAGITATAQDEKDILEDVVPSSLRADWLHLNDRGNELIAQLVANELIRRRWTTHLRR